MNDFVGTENFSLAGDPKLACSCGCGLLPKQATVERLQRVRTRCGFAIPINSGARCPAYNRKVSSTGGNGPHTTGQALDCGLYGAQALLFVQIAIEESFTGVGISQKDPDPAKRFVHVDDLKHDTVLGRPRPFLWSY